MGQRVRDGSRLRGRPDRAHARDPQDVRDRGGRGGTQATDQLGELFPRGRRSRRATRPATCAAADQSTSGAPTAGDVIAPP
ncbi:hypothetical protein NKG05_18140 [Oerskovia sp. M15]